MTMMKITQISQKHAVLITKSLSVKRCGSCRLFSEFSDMGWKHRSIDSLLKRIQTTGTMPFNQVG